MLEGLKRAITVSDLCKKYGLSQAVYYKWRDKFLGGGEKGLINSNQLRLVNPDKSKLEEYEKVIGRQTIEIQILKKLESDLTEEEFVSSMKTEGHSISLVCKVLQLSKSSYYRKRSGKTTVRKNTDKKAARIERGALQ